jgi:hypothetical protein
MDRRRHNEGKTGLSSACNSFVTAIDELLPHVLMVRVKLSRAVLAQV